MNVRFKMLNLRILSYVESLCRLSGTVCGGEATIWEQSCIVLLWGHPGHANLSEWFTSVCKCQTKSGEGKWRNWIHSDRIGQPENQGNQQSSLYPLEQLKLYQLCNVFQSLDFTLIILIFDLFTWKVNKVFSKTPLPYDFSFSGIHLLSVLLFCAINNLYFVEIYW